MLKRVFIFVLLLLGILAAGLWAAKAYFFSKGDPVVVQIEPGQSATQVAKTLKKKGVIRSELWFKMMLRLTSSQIGRAHV